MKDFLRFYSRRHLLQVKWQKKELSKVKDNFLTMFPKVVVTTCNFILIFHQCCMNEMNEPSVICLYKSCLYHDEYLQKICNILHDNSI